MRNARCVTSSRYGNLPCRTYSTKYYNCEVVRFALAQQTNFRCRQCLRRTLDCVLEPGSDEHKELVPWQMRTGAYAPAKVGSMIAYHKTLAKHICNLKACPWRNVACHRTASSGCFRGWADNRWRRTIIYGAHCAA